MNIKRRLLFYIIFFILYAFLSWPMTIFQSIFVNLYVSLIVGFGILNSIFAFLFLKWNTILNILAAFTIAGIGVFAIFLSFKLKLAPNSDAYGIGTAILSNAIVSIILWEITYQIIRVKRQ